MVGCLSVGSQPFYRVFTADCGHLLKYFTYEMAATILMLNVEEKTGELSTHSKFTHTLIIKWIISNKK